jgi:metal-responsive CopG/Arc/MetJ family transcriptional regulator
MKAAQISAKLKRPRAKRISSKSRGRKIIVDFPADLYLATEKAMARLSIDRSKLIRAAVAAYLAKLHQEDLERQLAEGYLANAQQAREIAQEFEPIDLESE